MPFLVSIPASLGVSLTRWAAPGGVESCQGSGSPAVSSPVAEHPSLHIRCDGQRGRSVR